MQSYIYIYIYVDSTCFNKRVYKICLELVIRMFVLSSSFAAGFISAEQTYGTARKQGGGKAGYMYVYIYIYSEREIEIDR